MSHQPKKAFVSAILVLSQKDHIARLQEVHNIRKRKCECAQINENMLFLYNYIAQKTFQIQRDCCIPELQ